jgi:hypothetical protein
MLFGRGFGKRFRWIPGLVPIAALTKASGRILIATWFSTLADRDRHYSLRPDTYVHTATAILRDICPPTTHGMTPVRVR